MTKAQKITGSIGVLLGLFVLGLWVMNSIQKPSEALAGVSSAPINIVGSRTGTTTTGVAFYGNGQTGSSTKAFTIGGQTDLANLTVKFTGASSTPTGHFTWRMYGSNDAMCGVATTTTTMNNQVVMRDINWYSLGGTDRGIITSVGANATGTVVSFTNLIWGCLMVESNGSSSIVMVQLNTKDNQ